MKLLLIKLIHDQLRLVFSDKSYRDDDDHRLDGGLVPGRGGLGLLLPLGPVPDSAQTLYRQSCVKGWVLGHDPLGG